MTPTLIAALLQLTVSAPTLAAEIKALFSSAGVTPEQEAAAKAILAKDPNSYFQHGATPAAPPRQAPGASLYGVEQRGALPPNAALTAPPWNFAVNDEIWLRPDGPSWIVWPSGTPHLTPMPTGFVQMATIS